LVFNTSIYPEKLIFEDLKERTATVSNPFKITYLINKKLSENINGTIDQDLVLSRWVIWEHYVFITDL
jgi:hypothetical protein